MTPLNITVIGCGIAGLTSALRLQAQGCAVTIVSATPPDQTTSAIAAAIWFPYLIQPAQRADNWAYQSYQIYRDSHHVRATGIDMVQLHQLSRDPLDRPGWLNDRYRHRPLDREPYPRGFDFGFEIEVPRIDTSLYLPFLVRQFLDGGGHFQLRRLASLEEAGAPKDVIVNCSGLGAINLVGDQELYPVRGQVLRVPLLSGVGHMAWDPDPDTVVYSIPRRHDCILGGTAETNVWDTNPNPSHSHKILATCSEIFPELATPPVLETLVGLRPARSSVRLEVEKDRNGRWVIHNYGHGGAGFTVAWGCAKEVCSLALSLEGNL